MFTGIIQAQGKLLKAQKNPRGKSASLTFQLPSSFKLKASDSIAVDGVCLTAKRIHQHTMDCDVMPETLRLTTLGNLKSQTPVNLEKPLTLKDPLGGHLVQGHVDGTGTIVSEKTAGNSKIIRIKAPKSLCRYFVKKDSVALDGVSLTITDIFPDGLAVSLIPTTLQLTTFGRKKTGSAVNLEVNLFAKLVYELTLSSRAKRGI